MYLCILVKDHDIVYNVWVCKLQKDFEESREDSNDPKEYDRSIKTHSKFLNVIYRIVACDTDSARRGFIKAV